MERTFVQKQLLKNVADARKSVIFQFNDAFCDTTEMVLAVAFTAETWFGIGSFSNRTANIE
jgi:hypothetical protein